MNDDPHPQNELDPGWFAISRFRPGMTDIDSLLELTKHPSWEVRWNAVRELKFLEDARTLDRLIDLFKNDPVDSVRLMAAQAIGVLFEKGVEVPFYRDADKSGEEIKVKVALARLKELKVDVSSLKDNAYTLLIPHELKSPEYVEIGYLMAQLVDVPFPQRYAPLTDVPSLVVPHQRKPCAEFRDSHPHGLKYRIYNSKHKQ
ncbi:MAG: HEAT repeat domain-containing protein [Anaerolineales bacterium]|nr:HEAT repeat domain-containing protein [Anaerolineales bacterium]